MKNCSNFFAAFSRYGCTSEKITCCNEKEVQKAIEHIDDLGLELHEHRLYLRLSRRWQSRQSREPIGNIAQTCQMSEVQVRKGIKSLIAKGLLVERHLMAQEIKDLITRKTPQTLPVGCLSCEWCKGKTLVLEQHHYPIPKSSGGTDTVSICGNCHAEFHFLEKSPFLETTVTFPWDFSKEVLG